MTLQQLKLLPWKKIVAVISVLTALTTLCNHIYNLGYTAATTEIQTEHNKLIKAQLEKHTLALQDKVDEYNKALVDAEVKRDNYWRNLIARRETDLVSEYEEKLKIERIRNETKYIYDVVSPDALGLLQQTRRIISKPTDYRF